MIRRYFPDQRAAALTKVQAVDALTQSVTHFREAAFEAVCGEVLAAFASLPALDEVTLRFSAPTLDVRGLDPAEDDGEAGDISLTVTLAPQLDTVGASVAEWDADPSGFFTRHFPLRKMGLGSWRIRRGDPEVGRFLDWCRLDGADFSAYRQCLLPLMGRAELCFGLYYLHHQCEVRR